MQARGEESIPWRPVLTGFFLLRDSPALDMSHDSVDRLLIPLFVWTVVGSIFWPMGIWTVFSVSLLSLCSRAVSRVLHLAGAWCDPYPCAGNRTMTLESHI